MDLGAFSLSLTVKDLEASKAFYQKLGFEVRGGDPSSWLIMKNGKHVIGLFKGMFDKNMLTFNPGWDQEANALESFIDIRKLQSQLKEQGVEFVTEIDPNASEGPAHFVVEDPDGNPILVDQHLSCQTSCDNTPCN